MKSRIPAKTRLSKAQRQAVREYHDEQQAKEFQRWVKLACVALHEKFGFGHDRLADFLGTVTELSAEREKDPVFWYHIDKEIRGELKLPFDSENYDEVDL